MRRLRNFIAVMMAFAAFSAVGASAQSFSGDRQRSERTIEQQVFKKLISLPRYGVFDHLTFQVKGNTVILDGKVISLGTRRSAESAVKRIPGVSRVINNIDELPLGSFDNSIRRQALRTFTSGGGSLYRYFYEPNPQVRIIVENGRLTLEGYVANRGDYNLLNVYAHGITNVFSVQNNLIVGKEARP